MFKEAVNDIVKLMTPVVEMPAGIGGDRPYDIVTTAVSRFGLSRDIGLFMRVIVSGDIIYIAYKGLQESHNTTSISDVLVCRGQICLVNIIDYDIAVNGNKEISLINPLIVVEEVVNFLKAKNAGLFYKSSNALKLVFDQAVPIMYIEVCRRLFRDSDDFRNRMVSILQKVSSSIDIKEVNSYMNLLADPDIGIEFLLDWSSVSTLVL